MKRISISMFTFIACLIFSSCFPQERVYYGDYRIYNQAGLRFISSYTSISGNLMIDQGDGYMEPAAFVKLTNVDSLMNLTQIGGDLLVRNCPELQNLQGLKNLTSIGGSLSIWGSNKLSSLDGLQKLTSVGGEIKIWHSDSLTSLKGLNNLTSIDGNLDIAYIRLMKNLNGLGSLTCVNGSILVERNNALITLNGLENLTAVGKSIFVCNNASLASTEGLENITSIGEHLKIYQNDELLEITLDTLNFVSNDFSIYSNCRLPASDAKALKDQILAGNGIGGKITIEYNYDETYPGRVWFGDAFISARSDFNKLSGYNYVTGDLKINGSSTDSDITDLSGLESLTRVGCSLSIYRTDQLTNLAGLENLSLIGEHLMIESNDALTSFAGLEKLSSVSKNVTIYNNSSLTSMQGLDNLILIGGDLRILDNYSLSESDAIQFRDEVLDGGEIGGEIIIENDFDDSSPGQV